MNNIEAILAYTVLFVALLSALLARSVGAASYAKLFAKKKYPYSFDKKRLPIFILSILVTCVLFLLFALVLTKELLGSLEYGLMNTAILSVGLFFSITYREL